MAKPAPQQHQRGGDIIRTLQVDTSGDPTSPILQSCASSTGQYFATTTASGISAAFAAISASLATLRIARW